MRKAVIALFISVLTLTSCSTFTNTHEEKFKNSEAFVIAFRNDYRKIDCGGCADCQVMKDAYEYATPVISELASKKDPSEKDFKKYVRGMKDPLLQPDDTFLPNPVTTALDDDCGCMQDAAVCTYARQELQLELDKITATQKYLDENGFFEGMGDGAWKSITKNVCSLTKLLCPKEGE